MLVIPLAALPPTMQMHACETCNEGSVYPIISCYAYLDQSSRYRGFDLPNAEPALFTTENDDHNTWRRRQVLPLYQLGALTNIEFQVDEMINIFLAKMERFARSGTVIDMAKWLHFYAFDCTGALTVCTKMVTIGVLLTSS